MITLRSLFSRRPASIRRAPKVPSRRLHLEVLEDRLAPAAHIGTDTYATIQAAVNAASAGAVITVDPGTYAEQVTVNKSVTIEGANAGINGASRNRTSESTVTWTAGPAFIITASSVMIDGFTLGDMNTPSDYFGIFIAGGVSGTHIQDNIVENNGGGIGLANGSGGQAVIQDNLISANTNDLPGPSQPTSVGGVGIWYSPDTAGGPLQNVLIQNNTFSANGTDIQLDGYNSSQAVSDITISNNWGDRGIFLTGTTNATRANAFNFIHLVTLV